MYVLPFVHGAEMPGCVGGTLIAIVLEWSLGQNFPGFVTMMVRTLLRVVSNRLGTPGMWKSK